MKFRRADILFIILIPLVVLCLWLLTTEQTTVRIPLNDDHYEALETYRTDGKKAAEQVCRTCHGDEGLPLTDIHPPEYRCMFCHKPESSGKIVGARNEGQSRDRSPASDEKRKRP